MRPIDMSEWDSYMSDMLDSRNVFDSYDKGYMDAMDNVDDWLDAQPAATLSEWIIVKEPPVEKGCYIVAVKHWLDGKPVVREAFWNGADWLSCEKRHKITPRVTHWMPLPESPGEE